MEIYSESDLCQRFLRDKIVRLKVESVDALMDMHFFIKSAVEKRLGEKVVRLDDIHRHIVPEKLNDFRMAIISTLNADPRFKKSYFSLAEKALAIIVGNEMARQRNINLSIQLPNDESSLLPVHCDTWSGDSPYEVVLWVPFVDCYGTKAMFYCDPQVDAHIQPRIGKYENSEELYRAIENHTKFIECKYGEMLIFTQNVMHGNRVNETDETRWSANCRFKGLFTPYADKKLGEFFEPIALRPATELGMNYDYPRL